MYVHITKSEVGAHRHIRLHTLSSACEATYACEAPPNVPVALVAANPLLCTLTSTCCCARLPQHAVVHACLNMLLCTPKAHNQLHAVYQPLFGTPSRYYLQASNHRAPNSTPSSPPYPTQHTTVTRCTHRHTLHPPSHAAPTVPRCSHRHTLHPPSTSLPLSYFLPGSLPATACSWSHQRKEGRLPWPEELQPEQLPGGCPWGLVRRPGPGGGQ